MKDAVEVCQLGDQVLIEFEKYVPVEKRHVTCQTHRHNSNVGNEKNPDITETLKIVNTEC